MRIKIRISPESFFFLQFLLTFYLAPVSRYHSYLNSASQILHQYNGEIPFAQFLKKFFADNKKFGSKDRKQVSNLCYCFYRLGKAVMNVSLDEKLLIGLFLCSHKSDLVLQNLNPEWNEKISLPLDEKLKIIDPTFQIENVFPWKDEISDSIEHEKFCKSFFIRPDLFLRLRPGKGEKVKKQLQKAGIEFESISDSCLALPNSSKIDGIIELDKEAVVQDLNSQQTGRFLSSAFASLRNPTLWDCCAGSGGKSMMAYDINSKIELTVSDNRESILVNLKKRFQEAGIRNYHCIKADLTCSPITIDHSPFDLIIADVPCTGSGTWSRTPEQLYFFEEEKIDFYASLQKEIISNVVPHVKPGGYLLYITCSVFNKENKEVVELVINKHQFEIIKMPGSTTGFEILKGYEVKADTLFAALLKKPL